MLVVDAAPVGVSPMIDVGVVVGISRVGSDAAAGPMPPLEDRGSVVADRVNLVRHHQGMIMWADATSDREWSLRSSADHRWLFNPDGRDSDECDIVYSIGSAATDADIALKDRSVFHDPFAREGMIRVGYRTAFHGVSDGFWQPRPAPTRLRAMAIYGNWREANEVLIRQQDISYVIECEDGTVAIIDIPACGRAVIRVSPPRGTAAQPWHGTPLPLAAWLSVPQCDDDEFADDAPDVLRVGTRHRAWVSVNGTERTIGLPRAFSIFSVIDREKRPV